MRLERSRLLVALTLVAVVMAVAAIGGLLGTRARGVSPATPGDQCQLPLSERTGGWLCATP